MVVGKPLVFKLLAVYKPNKDWFIEQLISVKNQNYKIIDLYFKGVWKNDISYWN